MSRAIGSSYVIRQTPGGERLGGLRITLMASAEKGGTVEADPTSFFGGARLEGEVGWILEAARRGVHDYAARHGVDLSGFRVVVSEIAFHPVDSSEHIFYQAAQSALRSALEAWQFSKYGP